MSDTGDLIIMRKASVAAAFRKLDVLVDGEKVGNVGNGTRQSFAVTAGRHAVQMKLGLGSKSEEVTVQIEPQGKVELECGVPRQFWIRNLTLAACVLAFAALKMIGPLLFLIVFPICIWCTVVNFKPGSTYYLKEATELQVFSSP